ncbi:MAG TPA: hypothetical protein VM915_05960 [Verrucomicrobiae bacterium]|nr:hypothetical protein [Verrucomicrobiae bacterium]
MDWRDGVLLLAMTQHIPNFHDGRLTGVSLGEGSAVLNLVKADGGKYELALSGLKALQVSDLKEGNIIDQLEVISMREPDATVRDEIMQRLFPAPHPSAAEVYQTKYTTFIAARLSDLSTGAATLIVMTPSYGADLVALCEAVQLVDA